MDEDWKETDESTEHVRCLKCGDYEINLKWDGCVNLWRTMNNDPNDKDYLHICEFREFVKLMNKALEIAKEEYPDAYNE